MEMTLLIVLLAGCAGAPVVPPEQQVEVAQHPAPGGIPGKLGEYTGSGGASLAYVSYTQTGSDTALVYLHGIESHAGWFALAADALRNRGFDIYCLDRRGSGLNRENRGLLSGHVDNYTTLLADMRAFITPLHDRYDKVFLVGLSWGGKLAMSYGLAYPEKIDGLVLITPGLVAGVDVSFLNKLKILLLSPVKPTALVPVPIEPEMFTTTPVYLDYIRRDPLRLTSATVRFFWQTPRLDRYIDRNIESNTHPMQLFLADGDKIIDNDGVLKLLKSAQGPGLDVLVYEDQTHSIQLDAPQRLADDMTDWLKRHSESP